MARKWVAVVKENSWTLAQVESTPESEIAFLAITECPIGIAADGETDLRALKDWIGKQSPGSSHVHAALASSGILMRIIDLPKVSQRILEEHFAEKSSRYFDRDMEAYLVDFDVVRRFVLDGRERLEILLIALPKKVFSYVQAVCSALGFERQTVGLSLECLTRFYCGIDPDRPVNAAIIDLGEDLAEILILENGRLRQYQTFPVNLDDLVRRAAPAYVSRRAFEPGDIQGTLKVALLPIRFDRSRQKYAVSEMKLQGPGVEPEEPRNDVGGDPLEEAELFTLEKFFVPEEELPFPLAITLADLPFLREEVWEPEIKHPPENIQLQTPTIEQALKPVFDRLDELMVLYRQNQKEDLIEVVYITGRGAAIPRIEQIAAERVGQKWSLPVLTGFPQGWQPSLAEGRGLRPDWSLYACLFGLIQKIENEQKIENRQE